MKIMHVGGRLLNEGIHLEPESYKKDKFVATWQLSKGYSLSKTLAVKWEYGFTCL
jgi:hypothetical protein